MTDVPRASADGGGTGSAVPTPRDWPDAGQPNGFAVGPRTLRNVARDLRASAPPERPTTWAPSGSIAAIPPLDSEPGAWSTARSFQHVHAQLQEGLTAFRGALTAGLPAIAAKLEKTATNYEQAEQQSATSLNNAAAPNVVGRDGRF